MTDFQRKSWIPVAPDSDFPLQNLPYGIFSAPGLPPQAGIAIGDQILILDRLAVLGHLDELALPANIFAQETLNEFIALGKPYWKALRQKLSDLLREGNDTLQAEQEHLFVAQAEAQMHLPVKVGDYTDFYSSIEHATNVGTMFRGKDNALMPNWRHLPVGYHGRASSIIVSGQDVIRPMGQTKADDAEKPSFGPSRLLDFELEMAFVVGKSSEQGKRISTAQAEDHIFGLVLFNDWSARDIQKWEYVPLGPFLGKSFASTISPWIVTLDALAPFRVPTPRQEPEVLDYLKFEGNKNYDIKLEVSIQPENGAENIVCQSNFKYLYWNMAQQLAHHSVNGCNFNVGDMCASGTISGPDESAYGSMLELSWRGSKPLTLKDGSERKFIQDQDSVILRGYAEKEGVRIGFGEARGKVLPAQ